MLMLRKEVKIPCVGYRRSVVVNHDIVLIFPFIQNGCQTRSCSAAAAHVHPDPELFRIFHCRCDFFELCCRAVRYFDHDATSYV